MKIQPFLPYVALVLAMSLAVPAISGQQEKQAMKTPSIEGTYQFVSRTLPNGTTQRPPEIMGLQTFTKTYRNFNVAWKNADGKYFSYSVASTYKLTGSEYSETILFSIMNDEIGGKGISYTMAGQPTSVPVKMHGGRLEFKMPFDPVSAVFEGGKFTATNEGVFVDIWEKVK